MKKIAVWDFPIRFFHWTLLILMAICLYTSYNLAQYWIFLKYFGVEPLSGLAIHQYAGVGIVILILFRIVWGFVGSSHARFWDFLRGPKTIINYLKSGTSPTEGHNPLGAYMVLAMLIAIAIQVGTGLFLEDNSYYLAGDAPLANLINGKSITLFGEKQSLRTLFKTIHLYGRTVLIILIALHIAAVLFYTIFKRASLIKPMITGSRDFHKNHLDAERPLKHNRPIIGMGLLVIIAYLVIQWLY